MDEADLLGDRIGIISHGQMRCSGTPLFLKRRYGEGYYLTMTKDTGEGSTFDDDKLTQIVMSHVPGSYLKESLSSELCFVLPSEARQLGSFKALFQDLEDKSKMFGIKSYGISDTSLEEVSVFRGNSKMLSL